MIEIIEGEQGDEAWDKHRIGSIGASSVSKIITSTGKRSTQRKAYMYQLAAEILTGEKTKTYSNQYMEDGLTREEETLDAFSFVTGIEIRPVSLIKPGNDLKYHCSPDSIVIDKDEGVEVKSVIPATQVKYLDKGCLPTEYKLQCQFSLFVTGWNIWHFCSYYPGLQPLILEVDRDEELIKIIKAEVNIFLRDLDQLIEKLRS